MQYWVSIFPTPWGLLDSFQNLSLLPPFCTCPFNVTKDSSFNVKIYASTTFLVFVGELAFAEFLRLCARNLAKGKWWRSQYPMSPTGNSTVHITAFRFFPRTSLGLGSLFAKCHVVY